MPETVAAVATPPGRGALAMVRITGPGTTEILERIFRGKTRPEQFRGARIYFGEMILEGQTIDRVGIAFYRGPDSYTGEDMAEITCHGGGLAPTLVLEALLSAGASRAQPGEFTLRAFLNGKLDLAEATGVNALSVARTEKAHRAAMKRVSGETGKALAVFRQEVAGLLSECEARLDFPEDAPGLDEAGFRARLSGLRDRIRACLDSSGRAEALWEGVSVVIAGPPNSGKSTLFNALLGYERAIVHHEPGTTRDYISESVEMGGYLVRLHDSAGTGEFRSAVDREAVARSLELAKGADIVLYLLEPGSTGDYPSGENIVRVCSKSDLLTGQAPEGTIPVSGLRGDGLEGLIQELIARAGEIAGGEDALLDRERGLLAEASARLGDALSQGLGLELVAESLWEAGRAMDRLLGFDLPRDVIEGIFSRFCIGK